jgi:hypothetical protein
MVISSAKRSFLRNADGAVLAEGLIALPLVLLAFAALVEFGYAVFQWNQTVKALQYGARMAAVRDPLIDMAKFKATFPTSAADPLNNSNAAPNDATISITCQLASANAGNCNEVNVRRLVEGGDGVCGTFADGFPGMCDLNPRIEPKNVVITYQRSGLGYWGRPGGPVLTMRMEVSGVKFDLPIIGALLGLDEVLVPAHPVTITTEDLDSCAPGHPTC